MEGVELGGGVPHLVLGEGVNPFTSWSSSTGHVPKAGREGEASAWFVFSRAIAKKVGCDSYRHVRVELSPRIKDHLGMHAKEYSFTAWELPWGEDVLQGEKRVIWARSETFRRLWMVPEKKSMLFGPVSEEEAAIMCFRQRFMFYGGVQDLFVPFVPVRLKAGLFMAANMMGEMIPSAAEIFASKEPVRVGEGLAGYPLPREITALPFPGGEFPPLRCTRGGFSTLRTVLKRGIEPDNQVWIQYLTSMCLNFVLGVNSTPGNVVNGRTLLLHRHIPEDSLKSCSSLEGLVIPSVAMACGVSDLFHQVFNNVDIMRAVYKKFTTCAKFAPRSISIEDHEPMKTRFIEIRRWLKSATKAETSSSNTSS